MTTTFHLGQRLSFESALCTVRYIGPVHGTQREWLGVEWDDSRRGKHDGEHAGIRYFKCRSKSPTAASFVRPSRTSDPARSFVDAVKQKYAPESDEAGDNTSKLIEISGKVVEEVGFDKIRRQLARLNELKIVLVDGLQIAKDAGPVRAVCPKIVELDISRNLFESVDEVVAICAELDQLKSLRVNGNRFLTSSSSLHLESSTVFAGITELGVEETLWDWEEISTFAREFPSLTSLTASSNELRFIRSPTHPIKLSSTLTSITLEHNKFEYITDISPLSFIATLKKLLLKGNCIERIRRPGDTQAFSFPDQLHYVDLSFNKITSWEFVDELPSIFPGLTALRVSQNPIYAVALGQDAKAIAEENFMLTLARIANLAVLNFSNITSADRTNAELFYLSRITKELAEVAREKENTVIQQHRRFHELCRVYGAPAIMRSKEESVNPNFLEARLIRFTFSLKGDATEVLPTNTRVQEIPKSFDIYQVKSIIGRLFCLSPMGIKLIWETGEWDPVAKYDDRETSDGDDDTERQEADDITIAEPARLGGNWVKREVELEDSTRQIGFCIDGSEAIVRIEMR